MEVALLQFATRPKSTQVEPFRHVAPERLVTLLCLLTFMHVAGNCERFANTNTNRAFVCASVAQLRSADIADHYSTPRCGLGSVAVVFSRLAILSVC